MGTRRTDGVPEPADAVALSLAAFPWGSDSTTVSISTWRFPWAMSPIRGAIMCKDPVGSVLQTLRLILLGLVIMIAMMAYSKADEVLHEAITGSGGLLCDETTEVVAFIDLREGGAAHEEAIEAVPGCGILMVPLRMRVTALGVYETATHKFQLVRYDFLDMPFPPQYGVGKQELRGQSS